MATVGVIGLGNMGSALAANLIGAGFTLVSFDAAGAERNPEGAAFQADVGAVASKATTIVLSLPDGAVSAEVSSQIASMRDRRTTQVVDTSTVGMAAARANEAQLAEAGISYIDAPVSGGVGGARARTLFVMYAGPTSACLAVEPVLAGLSDRRRRVGDRVGMAQALKLANNFLSSTALIAASEAIAFGRSVGLDLETMLDVLNTSSGQSAATSDKFVNHVLTESYSSGFANHLMAKDLGLYQRAVADQGAPSVFGPTTARVWDQFAAAEPGADFTRIYPFVRDCGSTPTM